MKDSTLHTIFFVLLVVFLIIPIGCISILLLGGSIVANDPFYGQNIFYLLWGFFFVYLFSLVIKFCINSGK
jgi:hypothetical protein